MINVSNVDSEYNSSRKIRKMKGRKLGCDQTLHLWWRSPARKGGIYERIGSTDLARKRVHKIMVCEINAETRRRHRIRPPVCYFRWI